MTWNWLDITILALALAQTALMVWIVLIVLRIRNGSVARLAGTIGRIVATGQRIAQAGRDTGVRTLPGLQTARAALAGLPRYFRPVVFENAPVTYATLAQQWRTASAQWARFGALRAVVGRANRGAPRPAGSPAVKARPVRAPLAERLGLVPPVWKKVAPLLGYTATVTQVWREVQKQLPAIRAQIARRQARGQTDRTG